MNTKEINLYINIPKAPVSFSTIAEALRWLEQSTAQSTDAQSTPEKVYPAPLSTLPHAIFHLGAGVYREKLVVSRPHVTFLGEGETPEDVVLVYGDGAFDLMPQGDQRGTFRTASLRIDASDFTASNITIQNDAGPGCSAGQALALYADGDRASFVNCRFLGSQDTIFTAPLPEQAFQPGGFKGPGEFKPRIQTRQYYKNRYLEGDVDFIFGSAICYFEGCTIFSRARQDLPPAPLASDSIARNQAAPVHGYVTAASTPKAAPYGYVFRDCKLDSDCPRESVYLGRPWREFAKTVFLNCELGEHIHPLGWSDWNKTHGHFYYGEYNSFGPGAKPKLRADFSHQLSAEEASEYTIENVLNGWLPAGVRQEC